MIGFIERGTQEFIDGDFCVTIEFATTPEKVGSLFPALRRADARLRAAWEAKGSKGRSARWIVRTCETCAEHHGEGYYLHAEIETCL